jgi:hypothetical protein
MRGRRRPRNEFAQEESRVAYLLEEPVMRTGVHDVGAGSQNGNRVTTPAERPHVGGPINAEGQSTYDRGTGPGQGDTEPLCGLAPATRGLPGAYDRHTALLAQEFETATTE